MVLHLAIRFKFLSLLKDKSVNFCDPLILGLLFILTIYLIEIFIFRIYSLYKIITVGVLFLISSAFLIYRIIYCKSINNNSIKTKTINQFCYANLITNQTINYDNVSQLLNLNESYKNINYSKTSNLSKTTTSKRLAIYFGSLILSLVLGIISLFIFNLMAEIVIGIVIAVLYIVVDTQTMIHRAESGNYDTIHDAYMLFVDFVKLFYKFLQLMQKKEEEKKKKKENK